MRQRRQAPGPGGYALTRLASRAASVALDRGRRQRQQREQQAAFRAWTMARKPLMAGLRAALADPAAAADLRGLAQRVAGGRVLTAGQEEHAWRLLAAARLFNDWAHTRRGLLRSLWAALDDPAAGPVLRELALQATRGTSRLGPRPLSRRQESLARELLSEMRVAHGTIRPPRWRNPPGPAAAARPGTSADTGDSGPSRRADDRLAQARVRRRRLRESNRRFEVWAENHQDVIRLLRDFTDDPRIPFLRRLAIQVTHGWDGCRMPLTPDQVAAVHRIFQARPDLRGAVPMPTSPEGSSAPEGAGHLLTHHRRGTSPSGGTAPGTARLPGLEAGQ
jgi:hypothetical protein